MSDLPARFHDIAPRFAERWALIARTRMAGVPVCNAALAVAVEGGAVIALAGVPHWVAVLVCPWFMSLVAVPPADEPRGVGSAGVLALPGGAFDALWSHEEALGGFWSVALFSPMAVFADQEVALATARAAFAEMTSPPPPPERSRRDLFRLGAGA